ncbi:MAG TPA: cryptochrome/photolyase family protein [Sandaracinaceae bacterium LLY-WYZ-13_1]|nr:cryptochrome/photolyase family protein [Sandaracinaceae bacterium LLY-WYZ-13_1]
MADRPRVLALVLGDQLDPGSAALDGLDRARDAVWMAEVDEEATHVWAHRLRVAAFLSAMRHHREALREDGWTVRYTELPKNRGHDRGASFAEVLALDVRELSPERLRVVHPGDHRVLAQLEGVAAELDVPLEVVEDRHFYLTLGDFEAWMEGRDGLVLESFYRWMRRRHDVLMDGDEPVTGRWNYDRDNRASFGREGPPAAKAPRRFTPDAITEDVVAMVRARFAEHPGSLERFDLPVTRAQARAALRDFVTHRLSRFGTYQDAMWEGARFLYHSRLSFPLNVKLLSPREVVEAAVAAWESGEAPIAAVEGFVRQVLGWRELVRGLYWHRMPGYARRNALGCDPDRGVPAFYWDGDTEMACVHDAMANVIEHGYAHHIQRLMVLGLFAQLLGVHPHRFHEWHMAMYLDAVDWVSLPNALGMSQYGDGGVLATKPYCASGNYIRKMSNHCAGCRYHPKRAVGGDACPFTTLYWDFLARHRESLEKNGRMGFQMKNLRRKDPEELAAIRRRARWIKGRTTRGERL